MTENPYDRNDDARRRLDDFESGHEYSDLTEKIQQFDRAREAAYTQISLFMFGEGGDTMDDAEDKLEEFVVQAALNFSTAVQTIIAHTPDTDEAKMLIANLYYTDEKDRLNLLTSLNPGHAYPTTDRDNLEENIEAVLEYEAEAQHQLFEEIYGQAFTISVNECLDNAPDNNTETSALKRQARHDLIVRTAYDIAKMAGAALIAVAITKRKK